VIKTPPQTSRGGLFFPDCNTTTLPVRPASQDSQERRAGFSPQKQTL
jgi:hypothetical protein